MANEYVATATDLTSIAGILRSKAGITESLVWPEGYINATRAIVACSNISVILPVFATSAKDYDELPSGATTNSIAISTDLTLGTVYVQDSAPEVAAEGDVYINNTLSEEALKRNVAQGGTVEIYINTVYIFIAGAWQAVTAWLYSGASWKELPQ